MIRWGMVGGGPGAFIGAVHRQAAALDGLYELVAGAFSADANRSRRMGAELGLDPDRVYASFAEMAEREAERPVSERVEVVTIVTPNHLHHPIAKAFLQHGFHVVCDKPLTTTVEDAEELCRLVSERALVFAVTYNYTGYPMVKEARELVRAGELGALRKIVVEYSQGWLRTLLEAEGHKQAEWRGDPARAGVSSALADIGSHAYDLLRYVTGLEAHSLYATLGTVVPGRALEDDATVLLKMEGGVRGLLFVSQIATGERNHLRLRVYGSERGLDWCQEDPDRLRILEADGSERTVHRSAGARSEQAAAHTRLPGGHPEGFLEAFANIYRNVARTVEARRGRAPRAAGIARGFEGGSDTSGDVVPAPFAADFPTVYDGAAGVHFIHAAVRSHTEGAWVDATFVPAGASHP